MSCSTTVTSPYVERTATRQRAEISKPMTCHRFSTVNSTNCFDFMHTHRLMLEIDSFFIDSGLSKGPTLVTPSVLGGGSLHRIPSTPCLILYNPGPIGAVSVNCAGSNYAFSVTRNQRKAERMVGIIYFAKALLYFETLYAIEK